MVALAEKSRIPGEQMNAQILKHRWLWISLAILAAALAATRWFVQRNGMDYVNPRYGPIVEAIYGLGKVKTERVYEVKLGVVKTLRRLYVQEGDTVKKGAPLVGFDGGLLFRAPFDGTVTLIAFREEQSVFPQQTVLRLEDLSTRYVEVSLEQEGALRVRPGQPVHVVFESLRGEQLSGKVAAIFSRNDEFLAHINVPLAPNVLPGMTADVAIETGRKDKALLVPVSAITDGRVRIMRDGKRKTVKLKIGNIDGNWAEVLGGNLRTTDEVIVRRDGRKKS
jgi:multidrug efflux pump subunit AcrA (membrane-fusion protein)